MHIEAPWSELYSLQQLRAYIAKAVKLERERCAHIVETCHIPPNPPQGTRAWIAAQVRAPE